MEQLLGVIGFEQRDRVLEGDSAGIHDSQRFSSVDAVFLIAAARIDEAQTYLLSHDDRLDGTVSADGFPWRRVWRKMGVICAPPCFSERFLIRS